MNNNSILKLSVSGLLIAIGVIIPMFSPLKILLEPAASFTLASHVAIFIAMFISPSVAASVTVGVAVGFLLSGFPPVVAARAASHIIFSLLGAFYLGKTPVTSLSPLGLRAYSFLIALVHAICELVAVSLFYFGGYLAESQYQEGFFVSIFVLVGIGTAIHSMVDFEIAHAIVVSLQKQKGFNSLINKG
ncbi:MAG: hypothetical protein LBV08_10920 [Clostridiales bacterium]|jgi:niacin transporter|nr:hypothetical protein [Clostridiales bacterium]